MNPLLNLFLTGLVPMVVLFTGAWLIQLRTKNAAIVDTIWAISFQLLKITYCSLAEGYGLRQWLLLFVVCAWGFRLGLYLLFRTLSHAEDIRYANLRNEWGDKQNILMLRFYYFQGITSWILTLPFVLIAVNSSYSLTYFEMVGMCVWVVAFIGESAADFQLKRFKENPGNTGKICNEGLWYYSRHPNYFFEWLTWVSFFIMALGSEWGVISIICPVVMYYFLTHVTGIVYTEKAMLKSRGQAFVDYQESTSAFFPWIKLKK